MSERTFRQAVDEKMMQTVMQRGEETVITDKNETLSGVDAQLYKEAKYINMLRTTPSDVALMHSDHRADSLVPGIEDGLKTKQKHRKKLRTRTIKNYDKAMEETQGYGTVQTIPLMRSMKDFYKNEKKQKKRVESDIIKLADMTIPSDIFDVIISEDHSHFDIKEAFRIREGLGRIREFKDTRPDDYAFLDVSVTAKLENLLLMKEPFEETLKVVLAANGLKEDGSVADQALIEESRRRYASTKEAFKEYADSFHEKVGASMASESSKRIKQAKERNDIETKKRAIRDDILDKDLSETESSAVIKEFKRSEFYLKIAFFMEEDRVKSREYVEKALKAWKYVQLSETQKKELTEEQKEYFDTSLSFASEGFARLLEVIPEMVHNLKGATVEQLLSMQEQIVNVSAQADYLWGLSHSVTDAENKMLFSKLGLSQTEKSIIQKGTEMLKTQLAILNGLKAIRLGSAIGDVKIGEIDYDLKNIAVVKDSKVDKKALAERGRTAYESARRITGYFAELDIAQTELKNEQAQTEINRKKALETIIAKESAEDDKKATEYGLQNVTLASGGADDFNTDVKRENLERLKKLHKASPFKYQRTKNDTRTDDEIDAASLKKFLRELQGNHDFDLNAEDLTVDYNATYFSLEELEKLCEDPTEEHVMEFMRPLIEFDPVKVLEGIDLNAVTNELSSRDRLQRELLRRTQKPLMLKQFAEDLVVKNGILSDASLALFDKACHKFLAFTGIVGRLTTPVQFSLTEFKELEIPGLKNLADCVDHMEEFEAETRKAGEEFEEKHPATQFFADEELVKGIKMQGLKKYRAGFMGGKFSMGAHNESGIDMISLPVSKEEMKKILDKDTEYLKSLEKVVRKLSLIDETGRPRLLGNEEEADLIAYGKKDLLYFAELSRAASIMRIAQGFDPKWVEETLGTSYGALMQNCKAIATIFEALSQKMTTPKTEMYQMRDTYKSAKIKMTEIEEVRLSEKTAFDKKMADKIRGTY